MLNFLVALLVSSAGAANCLSYEPGVVTLEGKLVTRAQESSSTAGLPRDKVEYERGFVLVLSRPVCVTASPEGEIQWEFQSRVTEIQLAPGKHWERTKSLVGQRVLAEGTLFGAHTGHHMTPVLLEVRAIRPR